MVRRPASRSTASEPAAAPDPTREARRSAERDLARAPRTAAELHARLIRRGFAATVARSTVADLARARVVDDPALGRRRAEELLLRRGYGRHRVRDELTRRGLADSVITTAITAALEGRSEAELARTALVRRFRTAAPSSRRERGRAYRFLLQRGHPEEVVTAIVGEES